MNARTKIIFKDVLWAKVNRVAIFVATFFLGKKSSQKSQDGLPHFLAIKTHVLIPYPRTRPLPARSAVIPPHLEHIIFSFRLKIWEFVW
jgi:hypothetical protein